jgi:hypothetical protein
MQIPLPSPNLPAGIGSCVWVLMDANYCIIILVIKTDLGWSNPGDMMSLTPHRLEESVGMGNKLTILKTNYITKYDLLTASYWVFYNCNKMQRK